MTDEDQLIGRVIGTEDATPLEWWAAVRPERYGQLDDVVVAERHLPGQDEPIRLYGVVEQVRSTHNGAQFDSDVYEEGVLADFSEALMVKTTRFEPETYVPPLPMTDVRKAVGEERDKALFFDQMNNGRLPLGFSRDGQTVYGNFDFINGSRGAHVNISGISGVATKTSYALFLLHSLFTSGVLGEKATNTKALVFSVKGEDLLHLDKANTELDNPRYHGDRERYGTMGLPDQPFNSVKMWAPPSKNTARLGADVSSRTDNVQPYFWTLYEFCNEEMLPFLFTESQDDRNQYMMVVANVTAKLKQLCKSAPGGAVKVDGVDLATFRDLVDFVANKVEDDEDQSWSGRSIAAGTKSAFIRRLDSAKHDVGHIIRGDIANDDSAYRIKLDDAQVSVVDIHRLKDRAQRFVVGATLRKMFNDKEQAGTREPLQFVVLDELNKYAPSHGSSPIKEILLDVAERGRSLGMVLIGAQQTASEVERRIVSNSSIKVVGRLDTAEASRQEYAWLPTVQRQRATILKSGEMLIAQPDIPVPLAVKVPFPAWATRSEEAAGSMTSDVDDPDAGDPFDGVAADAPLTALGQREADDDGNRINEDGAPIDDDGNPLPF